MTNYHARTNEATDIITRRGPDAQALLLRSSPLFQNRRECRECPIVCVGMDREEIHVNDNPKQVGSTAKTLITEQGGVGIKTPRDKKGPFQAPLVGSCSMGRASGGPMAAGWTSARP